MSGLISTGDGQEALCRQRLGEDAADGFGTRGSVGKSGKVGVEGGELLIAQTA